MKCEKIVFCNTCKGRSHAIWQSSLCFFLNICRCNSLQKEKEHIVQDYERNFKELQSKYDSDLNLMKQEHALSAAKVSLHVYKLLHIS